MLNSFKVSPTTRRILSSIMYLLFVFIIFNFVLTLTSLFAQVIVSVFTLAILAMSIYYEYLRYLLEQAIKSLNYDCDPEACLDYLNLIKKKDYFKGMNSDTTLLKALYLLATYQNDEVLKLIEDNDKLFRGNVDQLLIRNATIFIANVQRNNKSQAKKTFQDVLKLKELQGKKRKNKMSQLYSWEELDALYLYISNDYKKAVKAYSHVNPQYMNNREKSQYYYYYLQALKKSNKLDKAKEIEIKLKGVANKLAVSEM